MSGPPDEQDAGQSNWRRLRAFVLVAQHGSVNRAAEHLHLTASAVTRAVQALERELGVPLFERSHRGMTPTAFGELLLGRAQRAFGYLRDAERELTAAATGHGLADEERLADQPAAPRTRLAPAAAPARPARPPSLAARVNHRHLQALVGVADYQSETIAAQHLGLSQPAVTVALRELEQMAESPLFVRGAHRMVANAAGETLIRYGKLALGEIAAAASDMAAHRGLITGRIVIGSLPLSGTFLAPKAAVRLAALHPELSISVVELPYDAMLRGLLCGDVDVMVGAVAEQVAPGIVNEPLLGDGLAVVARRGHPLAARASLTPAEVALQEWVLPYRRTAWRNSFEKVMLAAGLCVPERAVEAGTMMLARGMLIGSDRLTVLSRLQIEQDESGGLLSVLPVDLRSHGWTIGMSTRADARRTAGLDALLACLRRVATEALATSPSASA